MALTTFAMKFAVVLTVLTLFTPLPVFSLTPSHPLVAAPGWTAKAVLSGLSKPRSVLIDASGNLLVLQSGFGITGHKLKADGSIASTKTVVANSAFNHGMALSPDGKTLFASSSSTAWKWSYSSSTMTATSQKTLVTGMDNPDHVTRTLYVSKKYPDLLLVSRGSNQNVDFDSVDPAQGRAMIKIFSIKGAPANGYDYTAAGRLFAYGVRNEVGLAEDAAGNIWGVENSADNVFRRKGNVTTDVHIDNPGEKVHNFGDPSKGNGTFYGYPYCFSVWNPSAFVPAGDNFTTGDWFAQLLPSNYWNDTSCQTKATKPRLLFQAHSAPLDIKFGPNGDNNLYVTLHGSWNRVPPTGYKVVTIPGKVSGGAWSPIAPLSSTTGYTDLLTNQDVNACSAGCWRPVGLAWQKGSKKLYVSSDATGEVFVMYKH